MVSKLQLEIDSTAHKFLKEHAKQDGVSVEGLIIRLIESYKRDMDSPGRAVRKVEEGVWFRGRPSPEVKESNFIDKWGALIYDQHNRGWRKGWFEKELELFVSEVSSCKGTVLEIACGTGEVLLPILKMGIDIFGFDLSPYMLEDLYRKAELAGFSDIRRRITKQNMVNFSYDRKFDMIISPGNSFMMLTEQQQQIACLQRIYAHLKENGRLLLITFMPGLREELTADEDPKDDFTEFYVFEHPDTKEEIRVFWNHHVDFAAQITGNTFRFKIGDIEHEETQYLRWSYKQEFQLLLGLAGFSKWKLYGDFDKSDYHHRSYSAMIWDVKK